MDWSADNVAIALVTFSICLVPLAWALNEYMWLKRRIKHRLRELDQVDALNRALLQSARRGRVDSAPEVRPYEEADHSWRFRQ